MKSHSSFPIEHTQDSGDPLHQLLCRLHHSCHVTWSPPCFKKPFQPTSLWPLNVSQHPMVTSLSWLTMSSCRPPSAGLPTLVLGFHCSSHLHKLRWLFSSKTNASYSFPWWLLSFQFPPSHLSLSAFLGSWIWSLWAQREISLVLGLSILDTSTMQFRIACVPCGYFSCITLQAHI